MSGAGQGALTGVLADFVATVSEAFTASEVLTRLVQGVVEVLDLDGAGVLVPDGEDKALLRFACADGPASQRAARAGALQEALQEGPCQDSHRHGRVVDVADLATEGTWPRYQRQAAGLGIGAVTAIPLRARGRSWGVLDLYRAEQRPASPAEMTAARTLADLATSYLVIDADRRAAAATHEAMVHRALHDPLTDLPVRQVLVDQLTRSLARLARHDRHVGVLFVDLDGLKYVNDTYGHAAGDDLLATCGRRIRAAVRPSDLVARVGGDEFVVLLEDLPETTDGVLVAHRVLAAISAPHHVGDQPLSPTASIGLATTTETDMAPSTLVAHADAAMYRAKRAGRGRLETFDADDYEAGRARVITTDHHQSALRTALETDQLRLHYQPVYDLTSTTTDPGPAPDQATGNQDTGNQAIGPVSGGGRVHAVEALLRWQRPGHGLLSAGQFLPDAECPDLMADIGGWVLHAACAQLAAWDTHLGPAAPERAFVNISALELADPDLPHRVHRALTAAALDPARLVLEITETALVTDDDTTHATIAALLDLGCGLAIDDFGTGYSALRRVVDIPATVLKIDRSFTCDVLTSPAAATVVAAVVRLGHDLDRTIVVEGVEDEATTRALLDLGATHLQGYHLAHPMPPDQITTLLTATDRGHHETAPTA